MKHFSYFITLILVFGVQVPAYSEEDVIINTDDAKWSDGSIVTVVLSQANEFHREKAARFKTHLQNQIRGNKKWGSVYALHETWPELGAWTIYPLIKQLLSCCSKSNWVLFCDENTRVNATIAEDILSKYDPQKEWFLGRAMRDREATIIHHFAFYENPEEFAYPDSAAGFVLSFSLLRLLQERVKHQVDKLDFSIDPIHELALFVWNEGRGPSLTDVPELCIELHAGCATHFIGAKIQECKEPVKPSDIFFAVKTCMKYHESRVQVILSTWSNETEGNLNFFSDATEDAHFEIIDLRLPNTNRGHCAKTMGIFHYIINDEVLAKHDWIVIADDDTLIRSQEAIVLGERYGFRTAAQNGYDYVTGGAGMVFNMRAVMNIVSNEDCECPSADTPDDMFLGLCLKLLKIPITHVQNFHQARPNDYNSDMLRHQEPVSFHKFWLIDPVETYRTWLTDQSASSSLDHSKVNQQRVEL